MMRIMPGVAVPIVGLAINDQIVTVQPVNSESMEPTLKVGTNDTSRDWILIERGWRGRGWRRNEIVVVRDPRDRKNVLLSRIRHVQGDLARIPLPSGFNKFILVPRGNCWIVSDNLKLPTEDSRTLGPLPLALVEGRVTAIVWPPQRWRFLKEEE
mmetsp:Transcript_21548/g.33049  ORF Transcript_21548/g.33049 Transcript_21548/m.33049 type:complete len:155 (-) Transcript_21548:152-616(-)